MLQRTQLRLVTPIEEGVYDQNILKAIFLGGSGGSGKGFLSDVVFGPVARRLTGLKVVNTDDVYEYLLLHGKHTKGGPAPEIVRTSKGIVKQEPSDGSSWKFDIELDPASPTQQLREPAKKLKVGREDTYIAGRLGLIIDSTATKADKIIKLDERLKSLGYDTGMVFVNTSLETSLKRNADRKRVVPEDILREDWAAAQANLPAMRTRFGKSFIEVDNNKKFGGGSEEAWVKDLQPRLQKAVARLYESPVQNPIGKAWIAAEMAKRGGGKRGGALQPTHKAPDKEQSFFKP